MDSTLPPCRFGVGESVSLWKWDRYERPPNKLGNCVVEFIERVKGCQSGYMITARNAAGATCCLDSDWLSEIIPEHPKLNL